ncbi:MAG: cysteine desulfurase [Rubritepida sp.]|nr:cysteine desulfurase [Rubritepida sp.]
MNEVPDRLSLSPAPDWEAVRARYPRASAGIHLNLGSRGLLSDKVHAAVTARLAAERDLSTGEPHEEVMKGEVRERFARLIGAAPHEIAFTANVSSGLNAIATAFPWQAGDNVVVCEELEHANNVYLWQWLAQRLGVELRAVPQNKGAIDAVAMAEAIDGRTRLVSASAVTFTPGFRTDLATIGAAARAAGAFFLVDGVQCLGVLRLDVERDMIDGLVTSTSKGLNGLRGQGFLYVRESWIPRLEPVAVARTGIATGGHYSGFEGREFKFRNDAQRFEVGSLNYLGLTAAHVAIGETLEVGVPAIEQRVLALSKRLADGLAQQGWPVNRPPSPEAASHVVTLGARGNGGSESTGDAKLDAFAAALEAEGVGFSIRRCLMRFAFHMWNDESDVETVLRIGARLAA